MASVMDDVDRRTQLAGHNRMELLMFRLGDNDQKYGINVFKVQEVIHCPPLTRVPKSNPVVKGIADIRGKTIPVIDLAMAIGKNSSVTTDQTFLIVTEYNRQVQGFIVSGVDKIVNLTWGEIKTPPVGISSSFLTAVTTVDDKFVEIIDVEKILSEVIGTVSDISEEISKKSQGVNEEHRFVFVVDDSVVARNQIQKTLEKLEIPYEVAKNGKEALDKLLDWKQNDPEKIKHIGMVISDVEMPVMDGYTFVTKIKDDLDLKGLYVVMHTSLSGVFNNSLVEKIGADKFLSKFDANLLSETIMERFISLKK